MKRIVFMTQRVDSESPALWNAVSKIRALAARCAALRAALFAASATPTCSRATGSVRRGLPRGSMP